jgi:hypothetical protein
MSTRFSIRSRRSTTNDSSRQEASVVSLRVRNAVRDLGVVLAISWLARATFAAAVGDAHSLDVDYWRGALAAQDEGTNPYETGVLNWPPLWLIVIVGVDYAANLVDVGLWTALRLYLVAVESALVVALYVTLLSFGAERGSVRRALLVGIALNPVAIILVCQHGNSDVQVGLLVTLAVAALGGYWRSRDVILWLCGCLFIGLGVLAKTAPLVLAPILAPGARLASRTGRGLGIALLGGPALLGVAVILALAPSAVLEHVIGYRSTRGFFGLSGMVTEFQVFDVRFTFVTLAAAGALAAVAVLWRHWSRESAAGPERSFLMAAAVVVVTALWLAEAVDRLTGFDARERYGTAFTVAVVALVIWLGRRLWGSPPLAPASLFLLVAVIFMLVVAFGPGYGAQYAYWFLPALIGTYVLLDDAWRRLLLGGYVVAGLTYAFEYAFVPFLGAYAPAMFGSSDWMADIGDYLSAPHRWVVFRLPLFVVYLLVIGEGIARLSKERSLDPRATL